MQTVGEQCAELMLEILTCQLSLDSSTTKLACARHIQHLHLQTDLLPDRIDLRLLTAALRTGLILHCKTTGQQATCCVRHCFMVVASGPRSVTPAGYQQIHGKITSLPCFRQPVSRLQWGPAQLSTRVQPEAVRWHGHRAAMQHRPSSMQRRSRQIAAQALNEEASQRQRNAAGSGSEAVVRGGAGSTGLRLGELVNSPFDADILSVALPALASIMLDATMLLVDTGGASRARSAAFFTHAKSCAA